MNLNNNEEPVVDNVTDAEEIMEETFPRELEEQVLENILEEEDDVSYKLAYDECSKRNKDLEDKVTALQNDVKRKNVIIIILIIIIILLLLRSCGGCGSTYSSPEPVAKPLPPYEEYDGSDIPEDIPEVERDYVTIPMLTDIAVSEEKPIVVFYNPVENEGLFELQYLILKGEDVLYDSGFMPAGEYWEVDLMKVLKKTGEHDVHISIKSRWIDTGKDANGGGADITITIQ